MAEDLKKIDENLTVLTKKRMDAFVWLGVIAGLASMVMLAVSGAYQHASSVEAAARLKTLCGFTAAAGIIIVAPFWFKFLLAARRLKKEYARAEKAAEPILKTDTIF